MAEDPKGPPAPPRPEPTADSAPYWAGLLDHRLVIQRCAACGTPRHYPRPLCDRCHSFDCEWLEASGRGSVHSWAVNHHAFHPAFRERVPFVTVTVDLEEGVRLQAPLRETDDQALRIGLPVGIVFEDVDDTLTLPAFRVASGP